jgi:hypothetical protein
MTEEGAHEVSPKTTEPGQNIFNAIRGDFNTWVRPAFAGFYQDQANPVLRRLIEKFDFKSWVFEHLVFEHFDIAELSFTKQIMTD